YYVDLQNR
nr:RecName: Full=Peroxidase 4 [Cycas revoluta]